MPCTMQHGIHLQFAFDELQMQTVRNSKWKWLGGGVGVGVGDRIQEVFESGIVSFQSMVFIRLEENVLLLQSFSRIQAS